MVGQWGYHQNILLLPLPLPQTDVDDLLCGLRQITKLPLVVWLRGTLGGYTHRYASQHLLYKGTMIHISSA